MILLALACTAAPEPAKTISGKDTGDAQTDTGDSAEDTDTGALAGPTGLAWSFASCGPTDGPAWEIYVGLGTDSCNPPDASTSRMHLFLYVDTPAAGNRFDFPSDGQAFYRAEGGGDEAFIVEGRVEITADGQRVGGTYDVVTDAGNVEGAFDASICDSQRQCG